VKRFLPEVVAHPASPHSAYDLQREAVPGIQRRRRSLRRRDDIDWRASYSIESLLRTLFFSRGNSGWQFSFLFRSTIPLAFLILCSMIITSSLAPTHTLLPLVLFLQLSLFAGLCSVKRLYAVICDLFCPNASNILLW
jgi:hypothetical protein